MPVTRTPKWNDTIGPKGKNPAALAARILVHFLDVLWKTTTWNKQNRGFLTKFVFNLNGLYEYCYIVEYFVRIVPLQVVGITEKYVWQCGIMFWKDEFSLLLCLLELSTCPTLEPQNGFFDEYAYIGRIAVISFLDKIEIKTLKFVFQLGLHSTSPSRLDFIFASSCRTRFSCSRMRAGFWYCGKERENTTLEEQVLKFNT